MPTTIDAVTVPMNWRGLVRHDGLYFEVVREFGAAMGHDREDPATWVQMREPFPAGRAGGRMFVHRGGEPQFPLFPKQHDRYPSKNRYTWTDGPDGAKIGVLTDEAKADMEAERNA